MSEILNTEAFVLSKTDFSETSKIATFYTKSYGKMSAIIKGGRGSNAKMGRVVDPINKLNIVFYKKDSREVQIISHTEIVSYYPGIKSDYDKMVYSSACCELVIKLVHEHEVNQTLYKGIERIFTLIDIGDENPAILFARFYIFVLRETGYALQIEKCSCCGKIVSVDNSAYFDLTSGILCNDCSLLKHEKIVSISPELFFCLSCLKKGIKSENLRTTYFKKLFSFLVKYTQMHFENFSGINSLELAKED